ncbi:hypothetical protein Clacol_004666 [Clathrus columnatus]|uniref:Uncharacterized protein n=1 Tax=Clathrus columnatus TaxID=1419009 RepID=A0AAV5A846_9AGAM|nr:hypothetical protein Clacol_004666 [Clathrus columnatus]
MSNKIRTALAILAKELKKLNITYGIIGAACIALGSLRTTIDIDLIVGGVANNEMLARKLNEHLGTLPDFTMVDADNIGYYTSAIVVGEDCIFPLAIFEPRAWLRRPQYQQVVRLTVILPDGTTVKVFSPAGMLREKIRTVYDRAVGILDMRDTPAYNEAFKVLILGVKKDDVDAELLQKIFLVGQLIHPFNFFLIKLLCRRLKLHSNFQLSQSTTKSTDIIT